MSVKDQPWTNAGLEFPRPGLAGNYHLTPQTRLMLRLMMLGPVAPPGPTNPAYTAPPKPLNRFTMPGRSSLGAAVVTRALRAAGRTTASIDIDFWKAYAKERVSHGNRVSKRNPLDSSGAQRVCAASIKFNTMDALCGMMSGCAGQCVFPRLLLVVLLRAKADFRPYESVSHVRRGFL